MSGGEQEGSLAAERYRLAGEILLAALDQTPAERSRFVREACKGDAALLAEVESLLSTKAETLDFLNVPVIGGLSISAMGGPHVAECPRCGACFEFTESFSGLQTCPQDESKLIYLWAGNAVIDGKYQLESCIGKGGMGVVYLVTEFLAGQTLEEFRREQAGNRLAFEPALQILAAVAEAIDYIHEQGVLHGDLKLANIFMASTPKLMDFGLASISEGFTVRAFGGTPQYMAPELEAGQAMSKASDMYAFGICAYALLTGRMPFEETLPAVADSVARERVAERGRLKSQQKDWRKTEVPKRLALSAGLALLACSTAVGLKGLKPMEALELRTIDARFATTPTHNPDGRIALIVVDNSSLQADETPLADRASEFSANIEKILDAGAAEVALDFLLPKSWEHSEDFSRLVLKHAKQLTFGLYSDANGETVGTECVSPLTRSVLGPETFSSLFAFVNLNVDRDGLVRRGRTFYVDRSGVTRPTWPAAVAARAVAIDPPDAFWIDHRVQPRTLPRLCWMTVTSATREQLSSLRNRLVLVGAEYSGSGDLHQGHSAAGNKISGLALEALQVDSLLEHSPIREVSTAEWVSVLGGLAVLLAATLLFARKQGHYGWGRFMYGSGFDVSQLVVVPI